MCILDEKIDHSANDCDTHFSQEELTKLCKRLRAAEHQRKCLAEAIAEIAAAMNYAAVEFSGPELLLICSDAAKALGTQRGKLKPSRWERIDKMLSTDDPVIAKRWQKLGRPMRVIYEDESK